MSRPHGPLVFRAEYWFWLDVTETSGESCCSNGLIANYDVRRRWIEFETLPTGLERFHLAGHGSADVLKSLDEMVMCASFCHLALFDGVPVTVDMVWDGEHQKGTWETHRGFHCEWFPRSKAGRRRYQRLVSPERGQRPRRTVVDYIDQIKRQVNAQAGA